MLEWLLANVSYVGIIFVLIISGTGLPIPEEIVVIAAGMAASLGTLDPWLAFASCLFGALMGDWVLYWIGRHFGRSVTLDHPRIAHYVRPDREQQVEWLIEQHGLKVFFLARFLIGLRSPMYLTAGILRVPFRKFMIYDLFCATTVIGTFFGLSYLFAHRIVAWWEWIRLGEMWLTGTLVAAGIGVVIWFYVRHRRRVARIRNRRSLRALRLSVRTVETMKERKHAG